MVRLRGHHLICLHFFSGEGFPTEYIDNLQKVKQRVKSGETVRASASADDICAACPHLGNDRCFYSEKADEEVKNMDETALSLLETSRENDINWQQISGKLPSVFPVWKEKYCRSCDWMEICCKDIGFSKLFKNIDRETV